MKSVLISIKPKWCDLIASGKKTIEVRKTKPKSDVPFKCYMYCTKGKTVKGETFAGEKFEMIYKGSGKVIGEFMCDGYEDFRPTENGVAFKHFLALQKTCLTLSELKEYLKGEDGYGWYISDLEVYDEPKELSEFSRPCKYGEESEHSCWQCGRMGHSHIDFFKDCKKSITRPPQSWCYVEELT